MSRTATTTISAPHRAAPARRLRQFLALDAVVTGVNGLAYLLLSGPLKSLLGVQADWLGPLGVFLVAYAVGVGLVAGQRKPSQVATRTIIVANLAWAAASLLVLAIGSLSPTLIGGLWVAAQAVVVGGFAAAQNWALRRIR